MTHITAGRRRREALKQRDALAVLSQIDFAGRAAAVRASALSAQEKAWRLFVIRTFALLVMALLDASIDDPGE